MTKTEIKVIGFKGDIKNVDLKVCNFEETRKQIEELKKYESALVDPDDVRIISWDELDDKNQPRSLLQAISLDRKVRVDEKNFMADRPPFAVFTIFEDKVVHMEFYEGHDELKLVYDVRSDKLFGKDLPVYLESDPQAYDPSKFLEDNFGIPKEFSEPLLEELHKEKNDE